LWPARVGLGVMVGVSEKGTATRELYMCTPNLHELCECEKRYGLMG
jgi:hypothetical protein